MRKSYRSAGLWLGVVLAWVMAPVAATAVTRTWTGVDNWNQSANWSPSGVPASDDMAIIDSGTVTLSNTVYVGSMDVRSGATVLFTNWSTTLSATNVTIQSGGKLTCAGPFTESQMSNRVYIACSNLTVASGGLIDVNDRGWAGGLPGAAGNGPGKGGWGSDYYGAGAAHGGHGGFSYQYNEPPSGGLGKTYGSAQNPILPGSGSGSPGPAGSGLSGSGGGAVRIDASGTVTVYGLRGVGWFGRQRLDHVQRIGGHERQRRGQGRRRRLVRLRRRWRGRPDFG